MVDFTNVNNKKLTNTAPASTKSASTNADNSTTSTNNSDSATKKRSININGKTHSLVISEDGTMYDYNEANETWVTRKGDETWIFEDTDKDSKTATSGKNVDLDEIDVEKLTIISKTTITTSTLGSDSSITDYKVTGSSQEQKKDVPSNPDLGTKPTTGKVDTGSTGGPAVRKDDNYVVAVIDNFSTALSVESLSDGSTANIGLTHGDLASAIITSGNDDDADPTNDATVLKYDLGSGMKYSDILKYLNTIQEQIKEGKDIDAINMSLGVPVALSGVNLKDLDNLTEAERQNALKKLTDAGYGTVVSIINKISELSKMGVEIYISAGNEANDEYGSYDKTDTDLLDYKNDPNDVWATQGSNSELYNSTNSETATHYSSYNKYTYTGSDGKTYHADANGDGVITSGELFNLYNAKGLNFNKDNKITAADFYNNNKVLDYNGDGDVDYADYVALDTNHDGIITGKELGTFNALTLATGDNVNVIGAKDSLADKNKTDGIADYSNDNSLVDKLLNGDIEITLVDYNAKKGKYGYDIDGDGTADLWTSKGPNNSEYNLDVAKRNDTDETNNNKYFVTGTSFSAPLAAKQKYGKS